MLMNKVLVGNVGAQQLEEVYGALKDEMAPRYLVVAGWAAAEAALAKTNEDTGQRLALMDAAVNVWRQALDNEIEIREHISNDKMEHSQAHRIALDIAVAPIFRDIIQGDVRRSTCGHVFDNCLAVASSNAAYMKAMKEAGNTQGYIGYRGFGYECNALLAFNRTLSPTWFAVPALARADSGYYHRDQTHDLMVIHQKYGLVKSATPVEIKQKITAREVGRYRALLVEGKMHLSVDGKWSPEHTLDAIAATHRGSYTDEDRQIADNAANQFTMMVRDYYAGTTLGELAGKRTLTIFRDSSQIIERHPGLSKVAVA